jgi:hypothetical protein
MTSLLDAPASAPTPTAPDVQADVGERLRPQWLLAALLAGAGAIHLAMAPSHLGESVVEGWGFLVSAWVQLGLAVVLVVRPRRWALWATLASSVTLIAVWAVSRTAGLPFGDHAGHAESVSLVDGACVALEAVAIVLAAAALLGRGQHLLARSSGVAFAGVFGALALTSAAIASPAARDHAAGSHGDHAAGHDEGAAAAEPAGHQHGSETADDLGFAALSNGHQHARGTEPLSSDEMVALTRQLAGTTGLITRFPTLAAAEAGGWKRAGPFSPGLGVHYSGPAGLDPAVMGPELLNPMLIFDGTAPDSKLAGFMFLAPGVQTEPEGFAGPNDHWHYHEHVCIKTNAAGEIETPFGADLADVTKGMCTEVGGIWLDYTTYMVHVWNVPGYESPDGMFTELNPLITCPDGTYHRVPSDELAGRVSACLNP